MEAFIIQVALSTANPAYSLQEHIGVGLLYVSLHIRLYIIVWPAVLYLLVDYSADTTQTGLDAVMHRVQDDTDKGKLEANQVLILCDIVADQAQLTSVSY